MRAEHVAMLLVAAHLAQVARCGCTPRNPVDQKLETDGRKVAQVLGKSVVGVSPHNLLASQIQYTNNVKQLNKLTIKDFRANRTR